MDRLASWRMLGPFCSGVTPAAWHDEGSSKLTGIEVGRRYEECAWKTLGQARHGRDIRSIHARTHGHWKLLCKFPVGSNGWLHVVNHGMAIVRWLAISDEQGIFSTALYARLQFGSGGSERAQSHVACMFLQIVCAALKQNAWSAN